MPFHGNTAWCVNCWPIAVAEEKAKLEECQGTRVVIESNKILLPNACVGCCARPEPGIHIKFSKTFYPNGYFLNTGSPGSISSQTFSWKLPACSRCVSHNKNVVPPESLVLRICLDMVFGGFWLIPGIWLCSDADVNAKILGIPFVLFGIGSLIYLLMETRKGLNNWRQFRGPKLKDGHLAQFDTVNVTLLEAGHKRGTPYGYPGSIFAFANDDFAEQLLRLNPDTCFKL